MTPAPLGRNGAPKVDVEAGKPPRPINGYGRPTDGIVVHIGDPDPNVISTMTFSLFCDRLHHMPGRLAGVRLRRQPEGQRTGNSCPEWQTLLLTLMRYKLNQLLELLELLKLRRHPLKQLLQILHLHLLKLLHVLKLLRHDLQPLRDLLYRRRRRLADAERARAIAAEAEGIREGLEIRLL